jgi:hypothetical protein
MATIEVLKIEKQDSGSDGDRGLRFYGGKRRPRSLVSTKGGFSALIRHGKTIIQIENDEFAVSRSE